jgi:UDP-N-acetylglucosamine 2-epimerase (non-hydrolysing)
MIHVVIGTRAQLFKMTPVMLECERRGLEWRWIYAAQHRDTFAQTLDFFGLPPADHTIVDWDTEAKSVSKMLLWTSRMTMGLARSHRILAGLTGGDHIVLTHGDTTTTVFGALLGRLTGTRVMHVESGLRSHNVLNPFPEELNRLVTFRLANYYACPGDWALANVARYRGVKVNTQQNTQLDVLAFGLEHLHRATLEVPDEPYVVLSSHRFENLYNRDRFRRIIETAERAAQRFPVLLPQHPVTAGQITKQGYRSRLEQNPNIRLLPRLEYENYLKAIVGAEFVMTDGGGNQEELYHLGKPTLILRMGTERQEGVGETAVVSRLDEDVIADFIEHYPRYRRRPVPRETSPTRIIVDSIERFGRPRLTEGVPQVQGP